MYDVIIIGAGPAGYVSAIRLSQLGKKVAIIEKEYLGGTCTNKGCIPTKTLLSCAHLYDEIISKSNKFGININSVSYDLNKMDNYLTTVVTQTRKGIEYLIKKNKIDFINATAEIVDTNHVKTGNNILETKNIILAHGSEPAVFPPFNSIEGIWTSDDFFINLKDIPNSILIVGGGVIGVEFATFLASLGKKVYIVELMDHILPTEDLDVSQEIKRSLLRKGVEIYEKNKVINVEKDGKMYISKIEENGKITEINSEKILLAVGRKPVIPEDVKKIGIEINKGIKTDLNMRTNISNIYAIGDIRADIMLAHVAMYEGIVAAHNIAGENKIMDYNAVPNVIFSNPEIATVGIKEKDANPEEVIVSKFPVSANARARTINEKNGFVKVIADKRSKKIIGISIVSQNATEMIMEGVLAVKYGMTTNQLTDAIHPHPTLSEIILEAIEGAEGKAIHI